MESTHAPQPHGPGHALERMIFFSDAVFAIAITLLIIEIRVPHVEAPLTDQAFAEALARLVPKFIGFFISFFVIGAFWAAHHRAFDCARHWSPRLVAPNLLLLSAIAAMPFFTALMSEYYGRRVPAALYCAWMIVIAVLNIVVQRIATAPPVVGEHVPRAHRQMVRLRGLATLLGALTAFAVSLFWPVLGQIALVSIPFWRQLLMRIAPAA